MIVKQLTVMPNELTVKDNIKFSINIKYEKKIELINNVKTHNNLQNRVI